MCLYSKQILPRRAKEDIIVYKELIDDILSGIITPYQRFRIKPEDFGKVLKTKGYKCVQPVYQLDIGLRFAISAGYFHCYKTFPIEIIEATSNRELGMRIKYHDLLSGRWHLKSNKLVNRLYIIVECTIPKGSQYWVGIDDTICSDKLILNRILSATELYELACNNK